jgi:integrase
VKAPFQPLSSGSLYDLVSDRLRLLGVSLPHYGPHSLRHACATRLLARSAIISDTAKPIRRAVTQSRPGGAAASGRLRLGRSAMKLKELIKQYTAFRKSMGEDFGL